MDQAKRHLSALAILGGDPAFTQALHVGRPNLGDRDAFRRRVDEAFDRRWLTNGGPLLREFEERVGEISGARHCVATCNATLGLQILARACDLRGEVIIPSFTFVATAHALEWIGLTPVFCDVEEGSATIDPRQVGRLITPRTTAVLGVHVWGEPCQVSTLDAIAARHGLTVLYDAAHALTCGTLGRPIGGFGRAEVFSFHATKFVNSFEGGAVVTDDDELAGRLRAMRNFGYNERDEVAGPGTNAKMSELAAAMGLTSLDALPQLLRVNRANYQDYRAGLAGLPGVRLRDEGDCEHHNFQYVVMEIDQAVCGLGAGQLARVLRAENVLARRYFHPGCHRDQPYRDRPEVHAPLPLPHTEALSDRVLVLPSGTAVGTAEITQVCELIRLAVTAGPELAERLPESSSWGRADRPKLPAWTSI